MSRTAQTADAADVVTYESKDTTHIPTKEGGFFFVQLPGAPSGPVDKNHLPPKRDDVAYLEYVQNNDKVLDFTHTIAPSAFKGRNAAVAVVEAGFLYAKANGFEVIPTCSYIARTFLQKKPEYNDLIHK